MTRRARDGVQAALECGLALLLARLTSPHGAARVSVFVGRDSRALLLAEAARGCPTPTAARETADWPLDLEGEPVGFLRFAVAGEACTLTAITAALARDEPRVMSLVTGLTYLATLADYFRAADEARGRHRAA